MTFILIIFLYLRVKYSTTKLASGQVFIRCLDDVLRGRIFCGLFIRRVRPNGYAAQRFIVCVLQAEVQRGGIYARIAAPGGKSRNRGNQRRNNRNFRFFHLSPSSSRRKAARGVRALYGNIINYSDGIVNTRHLNGKTSRPAKNAFHGRRVVL